MGKFTLAGFYFNKALDANEREAGRLPTIKGQEHELLGTVGVKFWLAGLQICVCGSLFTQTEEDVGMAPAQLCMGDGTATALRLH
jgi:hypothetical protein